MHPRPILVTKGMMKFAVKALQDSSEAFTEQEMPDQAEYAAYLAAELDAYEEADDQGQVCVNRALVWGVTSYLFSLVELAQEEGLAHQLETAGTQLQKAWEDDKPC